MGCWKQFIIVKVGLLEIDTGAVMLSKKAGEATKSTLKSVTNSKLQKELGSTKLNYMKKEL